MTRWALVMLTAIAVCSAWAEPRDAVFGDARAHWLLGDADSVKGLSQTGAIALGQPEAGPGALGEEKAARLHEAWFDAGKELAADGSAITVYLRARDPEGRWTYALFNKRGTHETVHFNLFSVDLPDTPGPDIGFEIHTDAGFCMISFPVSQIDPKAWHDFAGCYDGKTLALICDGKVMAKKRWKGGPLTKNTEPLLIGAESEKGAPVRPFTGELAEAAFWPRALSDAELARVMRKESIAPDLEFVEPYASPVHYRPEIGRLADTIPFFWNGDYHIFYLRAIDKVPWEHLVSNDLIHWKELPTALRSDGAADGPDGLHMFTGSVSERNGTFHIYYTGWNPANPKGREWIMHATSPDLIAWTKHPEQGFCGDGVHYQNSDFRDPYVFWNAEEQKYWMVMCARDAKTGKPVQGTAVSDDIEHWQQTDPLVLDPPLGEGTPECPDLFMIGDTHYLIHSPSAGTTDMRWSTTWRGPYRPAPSPNIDTTILYAAKRMFDGNRHVITGWVRDLNGEHDGGGLKWGGDQSVPREVYPGPDGQLLFRPVPEALAAFPRLFFASNEAVPLTDGGRPVVFDAPDNYLLTAQADVADGGAFQAHFRAGNDADGGYWLSVEPKAQCAEIRGKTFNWKRPIAIDPTQPITIHAFVQGSIIECFINDAYAFSCRAYDYRKGRLEFSVKGASGRLLNLSIHVTNL